MIEELGEKSTYSAKYQAPTTLEHVVLIIPLATAQLQSHMAKVPTMAQLAQAFKCHSQPPVVPPGFVALPKSKSWKIRVTKGRLEINIKRRTVGDRARRNGLMMRIWITNVSVDDAVWI